tara:strand:- start:5 stop:310 length:306 start_codon:yes stop_codon:yes gene_type:complete
VSAELSNQEIKERILQYLTQEENLLHSEENVIYAEKYFIINSVILWCLTQKQNQILPLEQFESYIKILQKYLRNELKIFWENDKLTVAAISNNEEEYYHGR